MVDTRVTGAKEKTPIYLRAIVYSKYRRNIYANANIGGGVDEYIYYEDDDK